MLIRSILGHKFSDLQSTVGVDAHMYEVHQHHIEAGGADWLRYDPAGSCVLAEAQARMVAEALQTGCVGPKAGQDRSILDFLAEDESKEAAKGVVESPLMQEEEVGSIGTQSSPRKLELGIVGQKLVQDNLKSVPDVERPSPEAVKVVSESTSAIATGGAVSSDRAYEATAKEQNAVLAKAEVDLELVQKFLDTNGLNESIKLLLEDFGGQDSFYELYSMLFTEFAVYVIVFNMEWLQQGSPDMESGLSYLRHWLHTVYVYCRKTSILIVGTHKDRVPLPRDHEFISGLLYQQFKEHPSWPFVTGWQDGELSTGKGVLYFFPVDNTLGNRDPVIGMLMRQVEFRLRELEYLQHKVPFTWMALLDRLETVKQNKFLVLALEEFCAMCKEVGFPSTQGLGVDAETGMVLRFFKRLGLLMHHCSIPHLVILRPAEFLFPYFTQIICDYKVHSTQIKEHGSARRKYPREFQQLQTKGILNAKLLGPLWEGRQHQDAVLQLMVSMGLMVPVLASHEAPAGDVENEFLVPSMLPLNDNSMQLNSATLTASIVFAGACAVRSWQRTGYLLREAVRQEAQVPAGFFSRLLGAIASLCQQTEPFPCLLDMKICRNYARFELGRSLFTLINEEDSVSVHIDQGTGYAISEMLEVQIKTIIERYKEYNCASSVKRRSGEGVI